MYGHSPDALSKEERACGLILARRSRPDGDVEVAWLDADASPASHSKQALRGRVAGIEAAAHDIVRLHIETVGKQLAFSAGQYADLSFGRLPARPYSMANRPNDGLLEFHIRRMPQGLVSGYVAEELCVGAEVMVAGPCGNAHLRGDVSRPLLLIAGGSGLAPMKSILLTALEQQWQAPIYLYHGVRDICDLYDAGPLSELAAHHGFRFIPVLSAPAVSSSERNGFVHEAVARDFTDLEGFDVYLGGPPPMVDAATDTVVSLGAKRSNIHADPFYAAPDRRSAGSMLRTIGRVLKSGRTQLDGQARRS